MKLNAAGEYLDSIRPWDQRRLREQDRPPACEDGDAADWDRRSIAIRAPPDPSPATRSIHICCASWRLRDRTRSGDGNHLHSDGAWLRRSRCGVGLRSTSRSVVATVDHHETAFCVERWRIPWLVPASRTSSTRLRLSVRWTGFYRRARRQRYCDQHGRNGAWRDNVFVERFWSNVKHEEMCPL